MGVVRVIETLNDVEEVKPDNNVLFRMVALIIHNPKQSITDLSLIGLLCLFTIILETGSTVQAC